MKSRSEQIRYALIARVLRRIELASVRQDHDAALKTYAILGKLDYLHYNTGAWDNLDTCLDKIGGGQ